MDQPKTPAHVTTYINNPFTLAVEGIKLLFKKASTLSIILVLLSVLGASSYVTGGEPGSTSNDAGVFAMPQLDATTIIVLSAMAAVILFSMLLFSSILLGIFAYTSAELAKGHTVSFKQATKAVFDRFWSFVWLQVLIGVKLFLWTLLFIVPGIIMTFRYSLANVAFFDSNKKLKGNAAIKESLALTKGAWVTTFGAQVFFSVITLGLINPIVDVASRAVLYRQFTALQASGEAKPKAHPLSWLILGLLIVLVVVIIFGIVLIAMNGFSER